MSFGSWNPVSRGTFMDRDLPPMHVRQWSIITVQIIYYIRIAAVFWVSQSRVPLFWLVCLITHQLDDSCLVSLIHESRCFTCWLEFARIQLATHRAFTLEPLASSKPAAAKRPRRLDKLETKGSISMRFPNAAARSLSAIQSAMTAIIQY